MNTIIEKLRNLIEDILITTGIDVFEYTNSKIFTLSEANVLASSILVYKNGVLWAATNYNYNTNTAKLTITGTLVVGDALEITYSYYAKYSDNELAGFIRAAITYLSTEKYKTFIARSDNIIFPTPNEGEEHLIALIAAILVKGDVSSYKSPELTITFEKSEPKEKKIKKALRQFHKTFGILDYIDYDEKIVDTTDD